MVVARSVLSFEGKGLALAPHSGRDYDPSLTGVPVGDLGTFK
jgi:hypothetical protein